MQKIAAGSVNVGKEYQCLAGFGILEADTPQVCRVMLAAVKTVRAV